MSNFEARSVGLRMAWAELLQNERKYDHKHRKPADEVYRPVDEKIKNEEK